MDLSALALRGLKQAQEQFEEAAARAASAGASAPGQPADTVDLSETAASLLSARDAFAGDIAALKTAGEIERQAIDLLA